MYRKTTTHQHPITPATHQRKTEKYTMLIFVLHTTYSDIPRKEEEQR